MITRRAFITTALAAPAALLALTRRPSAVPTTGWVIPPLSELQGAPAYSARLFDGAYEVQGLAVKVPSNRVWFEDWPSIYRDGYHSGRNAYHVYNGDWDGTFKLERGCSNPAFVLADLYERTGEPADWVVAAKVSIPPFAPMVMGGMVQLLKPQLDWQMLYDWGVWCDEMVPDWTPEAIAALRHTEHPCCEIPIQRWAPRFEVNAFVTTPEEMFHLRHKLRMHCLQWQSTDSRYRTSWPGVPYPEGGV